MSNTLNNSCSSRTARIMMMLQNVPDKTEFQTGKCLLMLKPNTRSPYSVFFLPAEQETIITNTNQDSTEQAADNGTVHLFKFIQGLKKFTLISICMFICS